MPIDDGLEDSRECAVVELEEAKDVEVAQQPRGDVVPATTRRSHRTHDDRVDNRLPRHVLQVVPVAVGQVPPNMREWATVIVCERSVI